MSSSKDNKINFTITALKELPVPSEGRSVYMDSKVPGLGIRVTPNGVKSFFVRVRIPGKQNAPRVTLGRFPAMTPEVARSEALKRLTELSSGIDPNKSKKVARLRTQTLEQVWEDYKKHRRLKPVTLADYERHMKEGLSDAKARTLPQIDRTFVLGLYEQLKKTGPTRASGAMRLLRALFNFANTEYLDEQDRPLYPDNPVKVLADKQRWIKPKRKQTVLRDYQVKPWWEALDKLRDRSHQANASALYFYIMLLTGIRPGHLELIAKQRHPEAVGFYNPTARVITKLPKQSQDEEIDIPLSDKANELMAEACVLSPDPVWVWPKLEGVGPIDESVPRHWQNEVFAETGIKFSRNDIRRSFATMAEALELSPYTIKRLLGHTISDQADVTAGYIISAEDRLRRATQTITDTFMSLVNKIERENLLPQEVD